MKRVLCLFVVVICFVSTLTQFAYSSDAANETMITVYALDGRTETIKESDFDAWHKVGWYSAPVLRVYALDARNEVIKKSDFDAWHKVGWYSAPVVQVYAFDGRSEIIEASALPAWKEVGWYDNLNDVTTILYSDDGREVTVYNSQLEDYIKVGWYKEKYIPSEAVVNNYAGEYGVSEGEHINPYAVFKITHLYDNKFNIHLTWSGSFSCGGCPNIWEMSAYLDRYGVLYYDDGHSYQSFSCSRCLFGYRGERVGIEDMFFEEPIIRDDYKNGKGYLYWENGKLNWTEIVSEENINTYQLQKSEVY